MSAAENEKDEVKKIIRSLLISSKIGLSPERLVKEYEEITQEKLHYQKFGFFNASDFFQSLTDVLKSVTHGNGKIILYGKPTESTMKIYNLVQGQNSKSKKRTRSKSVTPYKYTSSFQNQNKRNSWFNSKTPNSYSYHKEKQSRFSGTIPSRSLRDKVKKLLNVYKSGFPISEFENLFKEVNGTSSNLRLHGFNSVLDMAKQMSTIVRLDYGDRRRDGTNVYMYPYRCLTNNYFKNFNNRIKETISSNLQKKPDDTTKAKTKTFNDVKTQKVQSGCVTQSITTNACTAKRTDSIPKKLTDNDKIRMIKDRIIDILKQHERGLMCAKLTFLYEKTYNEPLEIIDLGFFSITDFLSRFTEQVYMKRLSPTGDWILSLQQFCLKKSPKNTLSSSNTTLNATEKTNRLREIKNRVEKLLEKFPRGIQVDCFCDVYKLQYKAALDFKSLDMSCVEQLLIRLADIIDFEIQNDKCVISRKKSIEELTTEIKDFFIKTPCDAVGKGISYKLPKMPPTDGSYFDVKVSHVLSPSYFIIQLVGEETTTLLARIMDELELDYEEYNTQKAYRMPVDLMEVGQVCVAIFPGDMSCNRAMITKKPNNKHMVEVLFVDYGDKLQVPVTGVFWMKCKYLNCLPALMIEASLANVLPQAGVKEWSREARQELLEFCKYKTLVASVEDYIIGEKLKLNLCDTTDHTDDIFINDVLVDMGIAVYNYQNLDPEIVEAKSTEKYTDCDGTSSIDKKPTSKTTLSCITASGDNIKSRNEIYTNSQANISVLKKSLDERSCSNTFIMPSQRALEERIVMKTIGRGRLYLSNSTATSSSQISYSCSPR